MTDKFKQECKNMAYKNRLGKIELENETISNSDYLSSFEIIDSCTSNGTILGNTNAKSIKVNTLNNYDLVDKQINPFIGVKYDDSSDEYIQMGKYTISNETNVKTTKNGEYTGVDSLGKLEQPYICTIEDLENATILDFYKDVCKQIELTPKKLEFINQDIVIGGNPFTNNESCRIVLQNIAQVFCSFVDIDWETEEIDLIWFDEEISETFTKKDYSTLEKNQIYGPINSISIKESAINGENVVIEQNGKDITLLEIEGKNEQVTRSGKNIVKFADINETTLNGITYSVKDDIITLNGALTISNANNILTSNLINLNATEDEDYTLSFDVVNGSKNVTLGISFRNESGSQLDFMQVITTNLSLTKTISAETINNTSNIKFYVRTQEQIDNLQIKVQLEKGSVVTKYEEPGASPSPDYPSEIKTVKGIRNLFKVGDDAFGTQLVTYIKLTDNSIRISATRDTATTWTGYVEVPINLEDIKPNTTYTFSKKHKIEGTTFNRAGAIRTRINGTYNTLYDRDNITFTTPENLQSLSLVFYIAYTDTTIGTGSIDFEDIMLEEGSIQHSFVPYGSWLKVKDNGKNLFGYGITAKDVTSTYRSNSAQRLTLSSTDSANKVKFNYKSGNYCNGYIAIDGIDGTLDYSLNYDIVENTTSYKPTMSIDKNNSDKDKLIILISGGNGGTIENSSNYFIMDNIQIEQGSTATEYEPYKEQSTLIDMNKPNLFENDESKYVQTGYTNIEKIDNGVRVTNKVTGTYKFARYRIENEVVKTMLGKTYTFSCDFTASASNNGAIIFYWSNSNTTATVSSIASIIDSGGHVTFTLPDEIPTDAEFISILFYSNRNSSTSAIGDYVDYTNIKLYEGASDKEYYELSSIDDVKDEIIIENGKAKLIQRIGKTTFYGFENETWARDNLQSGCELYSFYARKLQSVVKPDTKIISSHFAYNIDVYYQDILGIYVNWGGVVRLKVSKDITNITQLATWLSNNPVEIYYILKEPQTITLNGTYDIQLFDNINNIKTNDELEPIMNITTDYIGNIEKYTDSFITIDRPTYDLNEICIEDNYFLYNESLRKSAIDNIWNKIKNFKYVDCKITSYTGKPYLKRGNKIQVQDDDEKYFDTYVLSHTFTYDGTFKSIIESPALSKTQTTLKNTNSVTSYFRKVERICNKIDGKIVDVIDQVDIVKDDLNNNYYTIQKTNELIQTSGEGITNTFSEAGGNNVFRNTGLWFKDSNNNWEYWNGNAEKTTNDKATLGNAILLQNGSFSQEQEIPNGNYSVSFYYKLLNELATATVKINDKTYSLTNTDYKQFYTGEQDKNGNYIVYPIEVTSNHLSISFTTDIDNSVEIYDLMANKGSVKLAYSQNENEITTDTVNISKGITITSSTTDTKFKADSDGIRILNKNTDNETTKFTDKGMTTKEAIVEDEATIVKVLIQDIDGQTWFTRL